jgi:hypothetical protein
MGDFEFEILYEKACIVYRKIIENDSYARDFYGALCNNELFHNGELTDGYTFREAAGLIADIRKNGSYLDWYCSGNEGKVTDEVRQDLLDMGYTLEKIKMRSLGS